MTGDVAKVGACPVSPPWARVGNGIRLDGTAQPPEDLLVFDLRRNHEASPVPASLLDEDDRDLAAAARRLETRIAESISYTRHRRGFFRRWASAIRIATVGLSAAATVILGLQDLDAWTGLAFSLTALVTALSALEPFFNFRSIWVLLEEAQAQHHRLQDDLKFYLSHTTNDTLDRTVLEGFHLRFQAIWTDMESKWLQERRSAGPTS